MSGGLLPPCLPTSLPAPETHPCLPCPGSVLTQANWLREQGVQKGDYVAIYMPMILELPYAMVNRARVEQGRGSPAGTAPTASLPRPMRCPAARRAVCHPSCRSSAPCLLIARPTHPPTYLNRSWPVLVLVLCTLWSSVASLLRRWRGASRGAKLRCVLPLYNQCDQSNLPGDVLAEALVGQKH